MNLMRDACLIDGRWVGGTTRTEIRNPADGARLGAVPDFGRAEADLAIDAAQRAFPDWSAKTTRERGDVLMQFYANLRESRRDLADLLTAEQGKPIDEALAEIDYAASFLRWFAEEVQRSRGEIVPSPAVDRKILVTHKPVGVVGVITPWNFPAAMITRKIAPALAAGCTVVVKPAPQTPFTALAIADLGQRAGLPDGVLNVITGDAIAIGGALTASKQVRKLSFTGSTTVGVQLYEQSAATMKKLSLELGGNAPFIVFDDADIDAAIEGAITSKFRNAGQTCVCTNCFFVQSGVYDQFVARLAEATAALRVGNGAEPETQIGPLIDQEAVSKVERHIANATSGGARVVTGGTRHAFGANYFQPTVLKDVRPDMLVLREETFGPLAPVVRFKTEQEVVDLANASEFGLAAYFYSRDNARIWRVADHLEVGMVGINTGAISNEVAPFGGVKMSGLGREGSHHGLKEFLDTKYLCVGADPVLG